MKSHGAGMTTHGDLPALLANTALEVGPGLAARPRPLAGRPQAASVSTASEGLLRAKALPARPSPHSH